MALTAQLYYSITQDIQKLGQSILWLLVPDLKSTEKRNIFLIFVLYSDSISIAFELNLSNLVLGLYHLLLKLLSELQNIVAAYSQKYPFFSLFVIFYEIRILLQRLKNHCIEQISLKISDPIFVKKIMYNNSKYISYLNNRCLSLNNDYVCKKSKIFLIKILIDNAKI